MCKKTHAQDYSLFELQQMGNSLNVQQHKSHKYIQAIKQMRIGLKVDNIPLWNVVGEGGPGKHMPTAILPAFPKLTRPGAGTKPRPSDATGTRFNI